MEVDDAQTSPERRFVTLAALREVYWMLGRTDEARALTVDAQKLIPSLEHDEQLTMGRRNGLLRAFYIGSMTIVADGGDPRDPIDELWAGTAELIAGDVPGLAEPVLALAAGEGDDGFLFESEVAALKLNAELTVLSACNTGSGRVVAGEGVMSLSRAFMLAGSRAVCRRLK